MLLLLQRLFSKTFQFSDINYAVASREDKEAMFLEYSELLNSPDSGATTKIIFFYWEGDGATDHVGIIEKVEHGTVYTVEGNSGDSCKLNSYAPESSIIYGYGCPVY